MKSFMKQNFHIESIGLACYVSAKMGTPVHKNRPMHGLAFHIGGVRKYDFGDRVVTAGDGDIAYLPKGSYYTVSSVEPKGCYAVNFEISDSVSPSPFVFGTKNYSGFLEHFRIAERIWRTKPSGYEMKCKAELYDILYDMRKEFELGYMPKAAADIIKPAIEYIHSEYQKRNISVPELAALAGISETYFRRTFMKMLGTSPLKYINNLKLARAKELLASGMYSVADVSRLSGFSDECYFSREFKKAAGCCPSEYATVTKRRNDTVISIK